MPGATTEARLEAAHAAPDDEGQALADIAKADASTKAAAQDRQSLDTAEARLLALLGCAAPGGS